MHSIRTEETLVDFKTTFPFGLLSLWNDVIVKIARTYLMVKNGICKIHSNNLIMKRSNTQELFPKSLPYVHPVVEDDGGIVYSSSA